MTDREKDRERRIEAEREQLSRPMVYKVGSPKPSELMRALKTESNAHYLQVCEMELDDQLEAAGITVNEDNVSMTAITVNGADEGEFLELITWAQMRLDEKFKGGGVATEKEESKPANPDPLQLIKFKGIDYVVVSSCDSWGILADLKQPRERSRVLWLELHAIGFEILGNANENQLNRCSLTSDVSIKAGCVVMNDQGKKRFVFPKYLEELTKNEGEWLYAWAKSHDDDDFSYVCDFQWCRCKS